MSYSISKYEDLHLKCSFLFINIFQSSENMEIKALVNASLICFSKQKDNIIHFLSNVQNHICLYVYYT